MLPNPKTQRNYCIWASFGLHPNPKMQRNLLHSGLHWGYPNPKKQRKLLHSGLGWGHPNPKKPSGIVGQIGFGVTPTNPKPQYALCLGYPQAKQYCSSLLTLGWGDCNATQSTPPLGWGDCNATQATHPLGLGHLQRQTCSCLCFCIYLLNKSNRHAMQCKQSNS